MTSILIAYKSYTIHLSCLKHKQLRKLQHLFDVVSFSLNACNWNNRGKIKLIAVNWSSHVWKMQY